MLLEAIYHKPYSEYAYAEDMDTLVIRIRTKKDDLKKVTLFIGEKYQDGQLSKLDMRKFATDSLFDYYQAEISNGEKRFKYYFELEDNQSIKWYNASGFCDYRPKWSFFCYSSLYMGDILDVPRWFQKAVIYQVFPDRFYNPGYPKDRKTIEKWQGSAGRLKTIFGGTLQGIIDKLGHIQELGADTIYLNPVFKANSYHRYDTVDYYEVDPLLGGNLMFERLVKACHNRGMKIIIDGVFNHCSSDFFAFKDVLINGENSKYKDWFLIDGFPICYYPKPNYQCFASFGGLPKFNLSNPDTAKYLYDVAMFWTEKYGIDGWRFDVADEVDRAFWRKLRDTIKGMSSDCVLIGEIWDEASSWLKGDQFDSCLNYSLKSYMNDLIAYKSVDTVGFRHKLDEYRIRLSKNAALNLVNIIGSHDTPRFMTLCLEDKARFQLGVVLQFTLPGVPMIYYGDELGMTGEGDPECRKPMMWDNKGWDIELFNSLKLLIELRLKYPALSCGEFSWVDTTGEGILAFTREMDGESLLVVINATDTVKSTGFKTEISLSNAENLNSKTDTEKFPERKAITLLPYEWVIYRL